MRNKLVMRFCGYHFAVVCLTLLGASASQAATYDVGPQKAHKTLGSVPWSHLGPGDTVRIHWRPEPYREKLMITASGTAAQPIRIVGVPGPNRERPVLDGQDATTSSQFDFPYVPTQDRGLIIFTRNKQQRYGVKPRFVEIEGLELRNASRGSNTSPNTFVDAAGQRRAYTFNAAALWVERGEHLVIRSCTLTGSGNGLFVSSGDDEALQSRGILVEGCHIYGNGNVGRDREHNIYTEAIGVIFQSNHMGRLRSGAKGNNLKDRSAGTVVRYNWIEGGAHLLDLVEPEESRRLATMAPEYRKTYVYGNALLSGVGDGSSIIHYGGDSGNTLIYRKGTLVFFNNTVVIRADQSGQGARYRTILFRLETNDESVEASNNIFYRSPATTGHPPTELSLMSVAGSARFAVNWISPGWALSRSGLPFTGGVRGTEHFISAKDNRPGFVDLLTDDLSLAVGSPCVGRAKPVDPVMHGGHGVKLQYVRHSSSRSRPADSDLGAFSHEVGKARRDAVIHRARSTGGGSGRGASARSGASRGAPSPLRRRRLVTFPPGVAVTESIVLVRGRR